MADRAMASAFNAMIKLRARLKRSRALTTP